MDLVLAARHWDSTSSGVSSSLWPQLEVSNSSGQGQSLRIPLSSSFTSLSGTKSGRLPRADDILINILVIASGGALRVFMRALKSSGHGMCLLRILELAATTVVSMGP